MANAVCLTDISSAGTVYNTFTSQQSILTSGTGLASSGIIQLWPGFFRVGSSLRFDICLGINWVSGQTWVFTLKVGTVNAVISGTIKTTTSGSAAAFEPWVINVDVRCVTVGSGTACTLEAEGFVDGRGVCPPGATPAANYAAGMGSCMWSEAAVAAGSGFDSTIANTLDLQVTSGTSNANNGVQLRQYRVISYGNTAP